MTSSRTARFAPYLFLTPFAVVFLLFTAYPIVQSLLLSLQQTFGPKTSQYVGLQNFRTLLHDQLFRQSVRNTLCYTFGSMAIQLPLSLALAMLLNQTHIKGRTLFRLIFFSPSLIGVTFVAILFGPFLEKNNGIINVWLDRWFGSFIRDGLGVEILEFEWLQTYVLPALILTSLWMYVGFNMIYFLAALQNVDKNLEEAAMVDGAGWWSRFVNVVVPAIRPVAAFVVLLSFIGSLQLFELPYVLLNFGGGPGNRGLTTVLYLYQTGFEYLDLGYASAIGWSLAAILIVVAVLQRQFLRRLDDE